MKKFFTLLIIVGAILYFVSKSSSTNENTEISELKMELVAKENILHQMETDIEKIVSNARPKCEGGTVEVDVDRTPIIELQDNIKELKQKIAKLEG